MERERPGRLTISVLALAAIALPQAAAAADTGGPVYSPKLCIRTSNGLIANKGTGGRNAMSLGGIDFAFAYYPSGIFAAGIEYRADFDLANSNMPLNSLEFFGRYYFQGQGTRSRIKYPTVTSERHDAIAYYTGMSIGQKNYFLAKRNVQDTTGGILTDTSTTTTQSLSGSSVGLSALLGLDFRLSRSFELNAEANLGMVSFASSDERIRIQSYLMNVGVSFLW